MKFSLSQEISRIGESMNKFHDESYVCIKKKYILFLIYLVIPRTFKIKERQFPSTVDWHFLERWLGG
jgi:hypothetical protein